jgi:hypothetical protein
METSGFSDTQLQVREAIGKICTNFPDVSRYQILEWNELLKTTQRNTGRHMMSLESTLMNYMLLCLKMVGLGLLYPKTLEDLAWESQKPP